MALLIFEALRRRPVHGPGGLGGLEMPDDWLAAARARQRRLHGPGPHAPAPALMRRALATLAWIVFAGVVLAQVLP